MVDGDPRAPILIVGMAPGKDELVAGRPFVGGSGALLWSIAKQAGFTRADCYIINVIGEWPRKKTGDPTAEQITRYRPEFERAISAFRGEFVVPLGGVALRAVTGLEDGIEAWRGYMVKPSECQPVLVTILRMDTYKTSNKAKGIVKGSPKAVKERVVRATMVPGSVRWIFPTLHPTGVMRTGRKTLPAFKADLDRVGRAMRGELRQGIKFTEMKNGILPIMHGPFVIDVETMPHLRVGMAGRGVNGEPIAWTAPLSPAVKEAITREFGTHERTFIAHNAPFDLREMREHNMPWTGKVYDTMLASALLQPDLYKGLNEVASLYSDRQRWKHTAQEDPAGYNLEDVKEEYTLYEITRGLLEEEGMLDLFENTVMPALPVLVRMSERGLKMHPERRVKWLAELTETVKGLMEKWQGLVGNVNPNSPPQVRKVLYQKFRLPLKYNKGGSETAEKAALYELLYDLGEDRVIERDVLQTLLFIRKNTKLLSAYAKKPVGDDGCVHPYYLPVTKDSGHDIDLEHIHLGKGLAGTGRILPRDPNPIQLPKLGIARTIVIPHSEDMTIASFDFKQLELRIAAALSGDRALQKVLEHEDPFSVLEQQLKCDRTRVKNVAYGTIYGGGPGAIVHALKAHGFRITFKEAKDLQNDFASRFPRLWLWRQEIVTQVATQYFLTTPFGSKRYFYQGGRDGPAAIDFMCQGTAAYIIWSSLLAMDKACEEFGGHQLITAYDEAVFELQKDTLSESTKAIQAVMSREWPMIAKGFRVPVEVRTGPSWGELSEYKG